MKYKDRIAEAKAKAPSQFGKLKVMFVELAKAHIITVSNMQLYFGQLHDQWRLVK